MQSMCRRTYVDNIVTTVHTHTLHVVDTLMNLHWIAVGNYEVSCSLFAIIFLFF